VKLVDPFYTRLTQPRSQAISFASDFPGEACHNMTKCERFGSRISQDCIQGKHPASSETQPAKKTKVNTTSHNLYLAGGGIGVGGGATYSTKVLTLRVCFDIIFAVSSLSLCCSCSARFSLLLPLMYNAENVVCSIIT
jgi:hypothetical protein